MFDPSLFDGITSFNFQVNKKPKHFTNKTGYDLKIFLFAIFYCLIKSVPMGLIMASPVLISTCACFCISGIMYRNDNCQVEI